MERLAFIYHGDFSHRAIYVGEGRRPARAAQATNPLSSNNDCAREQLHSPNAHAGLDQLRSQIESELLLLWPVWNGLSNKSRPARRA